MNNHGLTFDIDQIVSDLGYYSPIELLLRQGRLRYADYESWRYGQVDFIAEQLMGSAKRINKLLSDARDYILTLNFTAEPSEFYGWKGDKANQLLAFCRSGSDIDITLLNTQYQRQQSVPQLDLFFDNQGVQLANELILALAGRNAELAEQKLSQLELADPGNSLCGQGAKLLDALQRLEQHEDLPDPLSQLDEIKHHLLPLAKEALQGRTRDYIAPFWRQLAENMNTDSYSEDHPDLHPAYCYTQILQWPDVIDSINNTAHWRQFPSLYGLLSQARYQQDQRIESLQLACDYCWSFPQQKPAFIIDAHSLEQYSLFIDLELDEKWGWFHFPAWLLLHEPGLVAHLEVDSKYNDEAFRLLQQLLQPTQLDDQQNMELRGRLKTVHDGIFDFYLAKFSQH